MATKLDIFLFVALLGAAFRFHGSAAQRTHAVGDASGWIVPPGGSVAYTSWASAQTFTVGDFLIFNFTTGRHDVAEVNQAAFDACNITSPISISTEGPANITLRTAGAHFYICTFGRHCGLGQKLAINVSAAPSSGATPPVATPQPGPSPAPVSAPTPSPVAMPTPVPSPSRNPQTYVVGDSLGWTVPPAGPLAYQTWANNKNFMVGDILVFNFANGAHNVAELSSKTAYDSCNTTATSSTPITGSPARITITRPGEHFFTCTVPRHCSLGQKLAINVTGTRTGATPPSTVGSPRPASGPSSTTTPVPSPPGVSAPPPPNSAPSFAGIALPITLLSIALAFLY
ncbi:hypothetical protein M9H77_02090 [Catharanthus roseus]|uniref:Uncharacterized protein n=1 Tax=Catharanthus roseus TaxID=4058 RepID=A0ACC0C7X0_CATRO|nr:hypothetical protein M9H77_02090 [Catharanthus roseus]